MYETFMRRKLCGARATAKPFFKSFKENFKQATIIWLLLLLIGGILALDIYYYFALSTAAYAPFLACIMAAVAALAFCASLYIFPQLAMFENSIRDTLIISAKSVWRCSLYTALAVISTVGVVFIAIIGLWQIAFFAAGIICFANSSIMLKAFEKPFIGGRGYKKF